MSRTINDRRGNIIRKTRIHNQYTWSADPVLIAEDPPTGSDSAFLPSAEWDLQLPDPIGGDSAQRFLQSSGWANAVPLHKDSRWWVRWPAKAIRYVRARLAKAIRYVRAQLTRAVHYVCAWLAKSVRSAPALVGRISRFIYFTLTLSYINLLLLFLPFGLAARTMGWTPQAVVALNTLSLTPLAFLMAFFAEELSSNCNKAASYLIESILANAVWLILGICAIMREQPTFIQSVIAGSIMSRSFLGLGGAFLAGGIRHRENRFDETVASTLTSLMMVGFVPMVACKILAKIAQAESPSMSEADLLAFTHGSAFVMLVWYIIYIYFRVKSHSDFFNTEFVTEDIDSISGISEQSTTIESFPKRFALWSLAIILAGTIFSSLALLNGIKDLAQDFFLSKTTITMILLPFLINFPENTTVTLAAYIDQMDQAVLVATSSVIHMNLVVFPAMVLFGWAMKQPVTLELVGPGLVVCGIGIWVTGSILQDGKSNYLEGMICICLYVIFALMFCLFPENV